MLTKEELQLAYSILSSDRVTIKGREVMLVAQLLQKLAMAIEGPKPLKAVEKE